MKPNRLGKFQIALHNVQDHPEMVRQIMAEVIVTRCEQMYDTDSFSYTAISEHFEEVELGRMIPEYTVICDGKQVTFLKI